MPNFYFGPKHEKEIFEIKEKKNLVAYNSVCLQIHRLLGLLTNKKLSDIW